MEAPDEWTLVTKKPRRTPTGPKLKKPVTTHSYCTLDIPRERDELALEEAHLMEKTRSQTKREQFKAWSNHRSLLFRVDVARSHRDRLMRQISEHSIGRDTHWNICHELRKEILETMEEEPAEWRSIQPIQVFLQEILLGKPIFPK
jgi:hypothetical protein